MADPLDASDLLAGTGPGCAHTRLATVLPALVAWRGAATTLTAFADLKTRLQAACPGVTWTNALVLKALRAWVEEG